MEPWMIEEQVRQEERPRLELPLPEIKPCKKEEKKVESNRGVIVINICGDDDEEEET